MAPACQSILEQSAAAMTGTSSHTEGVTPAPETEKAVHLGVRDPLLRQFLALHIPILLTRGLHLKNNIDNMKELKSSTFTGKIFAS